MALSMKISEDVIDDLKKMFHGIPDRVNEITVNAKCGSLPTVTVKFVPECKTHYEIKTYRIEPLKPNSKCDNSDT